MTGGDDIATIASLAAGGAGVSRLADGMTVFVPRTAPGDRVRLVDIKRHRRHAEALAGEVLEAGPDRVSAPCPHYEADGCGGCQWQHLAPAAQAAAKRRIVGDALRRIGKLDIPDPELVPSPNALGYRSSVTLTVRRRGPLVVAGFHAAADPDRVFPLERCIIARPELQALWTAVRPAIGVLPPGDDVRLKLRLSAAGHLHLVVAGGDRAFDDGEPLARAAREAGLATTVWWHPKGGAPRRVGGADGDAADVAFDQVNAGVGAMLHAAVVEEADRQSGGPAVRGRLLDLYAGAGDTAVPLAARGWDVALVELDRRAVRRAEERATALGLALRCVPGRVEDQLAALLPADVVVVNPPRSGLAEAVTAGLAAQPPARLVYVSCDPATLARDLRRLDASRERLRLVRAFDMFPQTSHVETLAVLERS